MPSSDIFADPIGTKAPPPSIPSRPDHPVPKTGLISNSPLQTNKFYSNFFLGDRLGTTYTFPYSVAFNGGRAPSHSWGIACNHVNARQRVFGPNKYNNSSSYYLNPVGIQSMVISAKELGNSTTMTMDSITAFSARVNLARDATSPPAISFPLVQGMAYITAQYNGATPVLETGVFFKNMTRITRQPKENVAKYVFVLEDNSTWRLYAWRTRGDDLELKVTNNGRAEAQGPFYGILQIAKDPVTDGSEKLLDDGAGVYPETVQVTGTASGSVGTYTFHFQRAGHQEGNLYMYALPHHVASFSGETTQRVQKMQLDTTTKGCATLVKGNEWTMEERNMPVEMGFNPWHPGRGSVGNLSDHAKQTIRAAAQRELQQNMIQHSNLDSMYFSGKALAKYATILYVVHEMLGDKDMARASLGQLKAAWDIFASNRQKYPLVYESSWGGIISSAMYITGNDASDFGSGYYNDHHFHYGYFLLAGAMIAYMDPDWLPANKDYLFALARDFANPSAKDPLFPMFRSWDFYHGHSWAHGLYASADGKDQESSSEDMMQAFGLKMLGKVSGDSNMEARANLQLAIMARSMPMYYLYDSDNKVQPSQFINNKAAGILFENKIDHATYFSAELKCIQGIHMLPLLPSSPYIRQAKFVREEWEAFFDGRMDDIRDGWKSVIYGNYATIEPQKAWVYFTSPTFDPAWLDGGASLTWYMAYAAAMANL
ncbi:hypothetical protein VHEMI06890 [[Torrubiella] hemipterigena]|nr:hypothetical protein VHEMI06890 [[Torrubiella] hemipterigena]